jgi:phosphate-selective porin OprO/OprP
MKLPKAMVGLLLVAPAFPIQTFAQNDPNAALLKRIEELEQQVKILSRKQEIDSEHAAEKAKTTPTVSIGSSGLTVRSADTNFTMRVHGYIQADSRVFIGDGIPVNDTFLLRRVRPVIEGSVFEKFDYKLMLDFASGINSVAGNNGFLQDAYVNARLFPEFQIQAGKFKEPVGLERLQSAQYLLFVERAFPTQLVPNRDAGVQLQGEVAEGVFSYAAGVFNGVQDGGSDDIEIADDDKDFAGRLFAHPFKNTSIAPLQGLGFGIAGTYGDQEGALRNYVTPGQQRFFAYRTDATGTGPNVVADGTHWRFSPQAYWYYGPFGVLGEYVVSSQKVRQAGGGAGAGSFESLEHDAWQVAASYMLTGEDNSFRGITPRRPFTLGGGGWGAWQVAARVSQLNLDDKTFPIYANPRTSASSALEFAGGINWYLNRNVSLYFDYEHTQFKGGEGSAVTAQDEDAILTRIQLAF